MPERFLATHKSERRMAAVNLHRLLMSKIKNEGPLSWLKEHPEDLVSEPVSFLSSSCATVRSVISTNSVSFSYVAVGNSALPNELYANDTLRPISGIRTIGRYEMVNTVAARKHGECAAH